MTQNNEGEKPWGNCERKKKEKKNFTLDGDKLKRKKERKKEKDAGNERIMYQGSVDEISEESPSSSSCSQGLH